MKDNRGEAVFSGAAVDKILSKSIIEHAKGHAQNQPKQKKDQKKAGLNDGDNNKCCKKTGNKKSIFKIILLAIAGMVSVACFLLLGNFYFIKKGHKKKR